MKERIASFNLYDIKKKTNKFYLIKSNNKETVEKKLIQHS